MNRRVVFALLAAFGSLAPAADRPNILLVVADDLGWSDVGWHGGFGRTPVMDRLVRDGMELDQHYVQPVCTPTRAALMSGRYPGRFGPHALQPSNLRAMPTNTVTLARALKSLGYRTHQAGKWHLGARPEWIPNVYGFDTSYGTLTGAADPWTHKYRKGPYEDTWHRDGIFMHEEGNATELIAAEAVRRIEQPGGPWFVYVAFHAVHTPVDAPPAYKKRYDGTRFDDNPDRHDSRLRMAAMVAQLDDKMGEFLAAIDRSGQRTNTLVIFTSDNGGIESLKNVYVGDVPDSPLNSENDPLRGQKGTLYEGGIRVCAFASWPGRIQPGKLSVPMHAVDWFPTLAELTGYRSATDLHWDGMSQWNVLSGGSPPSAPRSIYVALPGQQALRHGAWKLIEARKGPAQLFNLADDPYERSDVASRHPDIVADLGTRLRGQRALDRSEVPEDLQGLPH